MNEEDFIKKWEVKQEIDLIEWKEIFIPPTEWFNKLPSFLMRDDLIEKLKDDK
jgi:hypothetical protein